MTAMHELVVPKSIPKILLMWWMFLSGLGVGGKGDSQFFLLPATAIGVPFTQEHSYTPINQRFTNLRTKPRAQKRPQYGAKMAQ
jgi:hypothetical protein